MLAGGAAERAGVSVGDKVRGCSGGEVRAEEPQLSLNTHKLSLDPATTSAEQS